MYPKQEDSVTKARAIREAHNDDSFYQLPQEEWEQVALDLLALLEAQRLQDPVPAKPGTLRELIYWLNETAMEYPETLDEEVFVDAAIGTRPIIGVETANFATALEVEGEFFDPELHGLQVSLEDPNLSRRLYDVLRSQMKTDAVIELLGKMHEEEIAHVPTKE